MYVLSRNHTPKECFNIAYLFIIINYDLKFYYKNLKK